MAITPEQELAQIDGELARRGSPPQTDELSQIEAELAKRAKPRDRLKEMAPYYLGPLGGVRAVRDASNALDNVAYGAGGAVTDAMTRSGSSPEVAAGLGAASNVAVQAVPSYLGGAAMRFAQPAVNGVARWLMQTSLKPSAAKMLNGKGDRAIATMLNEGLLATKGGVEKLTERIGTLADQVEQTIAQSGAKVKRQEVLDYLNDVVQKFGNRPNAVQAAEDAKAAGKIFTDHPMVGGADEIPIQVAQKLKQGYHASLGDKAFGELKSAATESEKTIARGLRRTISKAEPSVAAPNARESDLINARTILARRMATEGNNNPLGLGSLVALQHPATIPLWLADRWGGTKSLIANEMYRHGAESTGRVLGGGVGAYTGRTMQEEDFQ